MVGPQRLRSVRKCPQRGCVIACIDSTGRCEAEIICMQLFTLLCSISRAFHSPHAVLLPPYLFVIAAHACAASQTLLPKLPGISAGYPRLSVPRPASVQGALEQLHARATGPVREVQGLEPGLQAGPTPPLALTRTCRPPCGCVVRRGVRLMRFSLVGACNIVHAPTRSNTCV